MQERGVTLDLEPEDEPTTESEVFYNTEMVTNRDISVACLQELQDELGKDLVICDTLAGSGVRGLRYLQEVPGVNKAILNDANPAAVENIEKNIELNGIDPDRVEVLNQDANVVLSERYGELDFVDLDPFGSPMPYLDAAARSLYRDGIIGVTATDLAPLFGSYTRVCERRYGSTPLKNAFSHETGLRILMYAVFTTLARYDIAFEPKLCQYERHYYRVCGTTRESKKACNRQLAHTGYLQHCRDCGWRDFFTLHTLAQDCPHCTSAVETAGPLWTGQFADPTFAASVADRLDAQEYDGDPAQALVAQVAAECKTVTPYYDTHELGSTLGVEAPRKQELINALQERGFNATETHFAPTGVRTNAPIDDLTETVTHL